MICGKHRFVVLGSVSLIVSSATAYAKQDEELVVSPDVPIDAMLNDKPVKLIVRSFINRLVLDPELVVRNEIKPWWLKGNINLNLWGQKGVRSGHIKPVDVRISGRREHLLAFWFPEAPPPGADGSIGVLNVPQSRITFRLGPLSPNDIARNFMMFGKDMTNNYIKINVDGTTIGVSFDTGADWPHPVATAAAGAMIAKTHGGSLSGPSWDVDIALGIKRPVRLLTLSRPLQIGLLRFQAIAVRVRDRVDISGRGEPIRDADTNPDPAEITVEARDHGPKPSYNLFIPLASLNHCSRLTFDKQKKTVELACRPSVS